MKLPDHPDALACEQPPRDGFNHCRLFHSAAHLLMRFLWTRWCPESDLNQRPTAYEAGALPLSYRGSDRQATAGACRDELLASNPAQAKPFRDINPRSRSWAQFRGGLAIPVAAREASGDGR